jgi:hypothetical protein
MEMNWTILGRGAGQCEVYGVEDAAVRLAEVIREVYGPDGSDVVAQVLTNVLAPLRFDMVTEGERNTSLGFPWSGHSAGLLVTLTP